ncbi:MAG: META domain-containing protein [Spirochaetaceae bacterium]|nr:META domain-containing protein [Spirochaetaceae bacterium]
MKKIIIFAVFLLAFTGCAGKKFEPENLTDHWILVGAKSGKTDIASACLFLNIEFNTDENGAGGKFLSINGFSGVNTFFGNLELNGNKIVQPIQVGSTRMAGNPALMEGEQTFMDAFSGITSVATPDENTIVFSGSGLELKYIRFDIAKLRLNLKQYYSEQDSTFVDVSSSEIPYLVFTADGGVNGSTGINSLNLGYNLGKSTFVFDYPITFSEGPMTLAASGDEKASRAESAFLNSIMRTGFIRLENNGGATFLDGEKVPLLIFETVYEQ